MNTRIIPTVQLEISQFLSLVLGGDRFLENQFLMREFKLSPEQIERVWLYWDAAIREYSNEVYSLEAIRMVMHLHNCLPGSWHEKRQQWVWKKIKEVSPRSICEIGFGVPQLYVRESLQIADGPMILLGEHGRDALLFAEVLLEYWNPNWKKRVEVFATDLNVDQLPAQQELYIFQDSLEHADNPTQLLRQFVSSVSSGTRFVFSLPIEIENPIPEHHIYWRSIDEVLRWIQGASLKVLDYQRIDMNPERDIFSRMLHPEFHEVAILAEK